MMLLLLLLVPSTCANGSTGPALVAKADPRVVDQRRHVAVPQHGQLVACTHDRDGTILRHAAKLLKLHFDSEGVCPGSSHDHKKLQGNLPGMCGRTYNARSLPHAAWLGFKLTKLHAAVTVKHERTLAASITCKERS